MRTLIRKASFKDYEIIKQMVSKLLEEEGSKESFISFDDFRFELNGPVTYFVYEVDGNIVGIIRVLKKDDKNIFLNNFYVLESFRNKKIGSKLLREVIEIFKDFDISLSVLEENFRAINLYEKFGFKKNSNFFTRVS